MTDVNADGSGVWVRLSASERGVRHPSCRIGRGRGLEGDLRLFAEVTIAAVADLDLAPGESVWVALKATEIQVVQT